MPPCSAQTATDTTNPLTDAHLANEAMPDGDEIKDAATKPRSSSVGTASIFTFSNAGEKDSLLPLLELKEWKRDACNCGSEQGSEQRI